MLINIYNLETVSEVKNTQMNFKLHFAFMLVIVGAIEVRSMGWISRSDPDPDELGYQTAPQKSLDEILESDPTKLQEEFLERNKDPFRITSETTNSVYNQVELTK